MTNVNDLLRDHVTLTVECLDRIYLNSDSPEKRRPRLGIPFEGQLHHTGRQMSNSAALLLPYRPFYRLVRETRKSLCTVMGVDRCDVSEADPLQSHVAARRKGVTAREALTGTVDGSNCRLTVRQLLDSASAMPRSFAWVVSLCGDQPVWRPSSHLRRLRAATSAAADATTCVDETGPRSRGRPRRLRGVAAPSQVRYRPPTPLWPPAGPPAT